MVYPTTIQQLSAMIGATLGIASRKEIKELATFRLRFRSGS